LEVLQFKQAMAKLPTGITILTIADHAGKMGITLSTFNSLSLDPLLVMFTLKVKSARYQRIVESEYFTLNILSEHQEELSKLFACNQEVDWGALELRVSKKIGCPIIKDVSAFFVCKLYKIYEGGDHSIIIGRVIDAESFDKKPLVYHDRQYKKIRD
jgi:flavin reductase (DIM6/NTAB) family NADH-FMN oxidoreductase RutF